jgi:D-sedoheptulose 7-phosphate isomerase
MNLQEFKDCLESIDPIDLEHFKTVIRDHNHIILLGNGGSNAITGHVAQDYTKALGKKAICFCDPSRLTCYANDYGWEYAYTKFLEQFVEENSLIILISSSGNSQNILNAAEFCVGMYNMVTFSGFEPNNKLRIKYQYDSDLHFYVPSKDYGIVEYIHGIILHSVI